MNTERILSAHYLLLAASLALALSAAAYGKDTDVYLKAPGISRDDSPNVLIILDNSGSMESNSITSFPPYDATVTYTGSYDNTKVYWSTTSSLPGSGTSRWFPASNNKCTASLANLGSSAGATGYYASDTIVGWIWKTSGGNTSSTQGRWNDLSGGNNTDGNAKMADVECAQDNPADATAGTYLTDSSNSNLAYGSRYTSTSANALQFSNYTKPTLYSGNYLNFKANPPGATSQTRMQIAKDAVKTIIDANKGVRFGLMVFNRNNSTPHGGRVLAHVDNMDDARRTSMKAMVDTITGYADAAQTQQNYTPLSETMWEAYRYLSGSTVTYGNPSPAQVPAQDLCAQDTTACTQTGTYVSPFSLACQKAYVIIVTDGDPTNDDDADAAIGALPGIGTINGNPLDELAGWMNTHDVYADFAGNQTVVTYTVGFDTGISASGLQLLQDTAAKGGGSYHSATNGSELATALQGAIIDALQVTTSFTAPALSVNAFNTLFNRDDVYFAMFKPSSKERWNGNVKKYSLCKDTSATPTCKYGEIIDQNGVPAVDITTLRIKDSATSYWSSVVDGSEVNKGGAGSHVATYASRKVYTYTGGFDTNGITPTGGPIDLTTTAHEVATTNAALTQAMLGVSTTTDRDNIINWIRGQDVFDEDQNTVTAEDRVWRFYDPVHSRPVIVNYGGSSSSPILKVFVGTNDGMIHMINENTGVEEWAFLPPDLLPNQQSLASDSDGDHTWGMDNTPSFDIQDKSRDGSGNIVDIPDGIINPGDGDYVHMYFSMRRGGRNIYALDVTPTATLTSVTATGGINPKLMWVIRGGTSTGYAALGQTWSQPLIRTIRMGTGAGSGTTAESALTKVALFAGGYDPTNDLQIPAPTTSQGNAIFIANASTGERIWWASGASSGADLQLNNMDYSIPSDLTPLDSNGDSAVDRIYVGDLGGQVWRIDLSPTLRQGNNGGSSGYVFADLACTSGSRPSCAGTPLQDRRRFFYPPDIAQVSDSIYGSPSAPKYDIVTIASGDREDPLDFLTENQTPTQTPVHNRIYALRDFKIDAMSTGGSITYPASIKDANLYDATSSALQTATGTAIAASGIQTSSGWYVDLVDSGGAWIGEKSLARTSIFGGTLYVTTFTPASPTTGKVTCAANEGLGTLYALNILDGAASMDLNGDGTVDSSDRQVNVGGGIPSEHVIVIREGGNSDLVGTSAPGAVNKNLQRAKTYWFQ
jgi:type IV pilus assembly protein PilY1